MTAKEIAWNLACRPSSPFCHRRQLVVVSNVSWGLLQWEADLIVCSKAGFLTEVEIKISMADWRADLAKDKWVPNRFQKSKQMIKQFYYAAPEGLAEQYAAVRNSNMVTGFDLLPSHAGIVSVGRRRVTILKPAEVIPGNRALTLEERLKLARLGAIKAWRRSPDVKLPVEITDDGEIIDSDPTT